MKAAESKTAEGLHQHAGDPVGHWRTSPMSFLNGREEVLRFDALEQIASCTRCQEIEYLLIFGLDGQHDELRVGRLFLKFADTLELTHRGSLQIDPYMFAPWLRALGYRIRGSGLGRRERLRSVFLTGASDRTAEPPR